LQRLQSWTVAEQAKEEYIRIGSDSRKICSSVPPVFRFLSVVRARNMSEANEEDDRGQAVMIMTLTKRDLVVRISEETGLIQNEVLNVVQKALDHISDALAKGDKVELRNFGVFEVRIAKAHTGRNPQKPEIEVPIPARATVKFKAGKEMDAEVLKLTPSTIEEAPRTIRVP